MKPEQQLSDLNRTFPGPDADTIAVDVPANWRLCLTGYEMNHPGLTESKVQQTLQYYGLDTLGAQYLAQDVLHCRKNYDYYKMLAEKEGTVWPPKDVMQDGKAGLVADPSTIIWTIFGIMLALVILYCLYIKVDAWLHPQL
ncbi:hypothetical protein CGCF413_v015600 [Colletotrichum fructicola]|uniref:Uncharacterized protein n=1 Tax=Colletotrichum fructicola (strain Nara gc5) TaxID=1213859 RepID=L2FD48_COLFN|nr:hypothetical protein CGCF413_v015600 [Colletotrichum fructicola]